MNKILVSSLFALCLLSVFQSCKKNNIENFQAFVAEPAAGACTVYDETGYAFTYRIKGLTTEEQNAFFTGNSLFNQNWVLAPASTTGRDGLGPLFNAKSCAGCHFRDGRGAPEKNLGLLFRLGSSSSGGGIADLIYGSQLQDNSHPDAEPEGNMNISYVTVSGTYADGTPYSLRKPVYSISGLNYGALTSSVRISPRVAQIMVGLGLLELIPESDLLQGSDESDIDGDGISGRPNYIHDVLTGQLVIGRFGWKANQPNIRQQVAAAFNGDIGITSSLFPIENFTSHQQSCSNLPNGGSPEISDENLEAVTTYAKTLAVPAQRTPNATASGQNLFVNAQCGKCHTPRHMTGSGGNISALKNVIIRPYTDLLLHDMGDQLGDGLEDGLANGNEWRTPPLWGIGLIKTVNGHSYLMHDGRARSIEEAILWHGGEAEKSKNNFKKLNKNQRKELLDFLNSL